MGKKREIERKRERIVGCTGCSCFFFWTLASASASSFPSSSPLVVGSPRSGHPRFRARGALRGIFSSWYANIYIYVYIRNSLSFFAKTLALPWAPPPISILGLMHEECRVPRNNIFRVFRDPCNIRNIFMNIWADHTVRAGHSVRAPICFMKFERGKRVAVRKVSLSRTREGREETISLFWRRCLGSAQPITENAGIV